MGAVVLLCLVALGVWSCFGQPALPTIQVTTKTGTKPYRLQYFVVDDTAQIVRAPRQQVDVFPLVSQNQTVTLQCEVIRYTLPIVFNEGRAFYNKTFDYTSKQIVIAMDHPPAPDETVAVFYTTDGSGCAPTAMITTPMPAKALGAIGSANVIRSTSPGVAETKKK